MSYLHTPPKTQDMAEKWVLATFARHVLANIKPPKKTFNHRKFELDSWYEYHAIKLQCNQFLEDLGDPSPKWGRPKHFKALSKKKIPVDLTGWKYLEELKISNSSFQKFSRVKFFTIHLRFRLMETCDGFFLGKGADSEIHLCAFPNLLSKEKIEGSSSIKISLYSFENCVSFLRNTLRHELQHLTQEILAICLQHLGRAPDSEDSAPGNPTIGDCCPTLQGKGVSSLEYYLRGEEFYPWLQNELDVIRHDIQRLGYRLGSNKRAFEKKMYSNTEIFKSAFFRALYDYDRLRWKKAVKEAYAYCSDLLVK